MVGQRKLISLEECINWCNEEELCLAVAVSPSYWAYRECFRVTFTDINFRAGWSAAYKSCFGTPPPGYFLEYVGSKVASCLKIIGSVTCSEGTEFTITGLQPLCLQGQRFSA